MKSEWDKGMKLTWGDIISLEYGKPVPDKFQTNGDVPVFGTNGQIGTSNLPPLCSHASTIVGRKGAYRGVHYSNVPFSVIDTAFFVEETTKLTDSKWIYYKLLTLDINRMDSGSAIPSTDRSEIYSLPVTVPPLPTQRKIASILSALDDKIETNNAICRNLEEQARALYELWLSKRKNECEWLSLEAIADLNPEAYSIKEKWGYINYLDTGNITDGVISSIQKIDLEQDELPSRARRKVKAGDVVFSTVRPNQRHFGILHSPLPNMLVSTGFTVIRSNKTDISNELIYLLLSDSSFVEKMQQIGEQSVSAYPSVKPTDIATCQIPFMDSMDYFQMQKVICAMFSQSAVLKDVNRYLSDMRDSLLPKLMNGEIDLGKLGKLA